MCLFFIPIVRTTEYKFMNQIMELFIYWRSRIFFSLISCAILVLFASNIFAQNSLVAVGSDASMSDSSQIDTFWHDSQEILSTKERESLIALCSPMADSMEGGPLASNWNTVIMKPKSRFEIQSKYYREGWRALAISLHENDLPFNKDNKNEKKIHKHELRIANHQRCNFGQEVWYSFSFRVVGDYPRKGSTRWVIGQWKEDSGANPFLAQRFDNGVFHITIQQNDCRILIASALGDPDEKFQFYSEEFKKALHHGKEKNDGIDIQQKLNSFGSSAIDIQLMKISIMNQDIAKFPFVADPTSYCKIEGLTISISESALIPDPGSDWVDMRYRVKGDRNGNGVIEVWANGKHIVRVTGKIGSDDPDGPTQYFKIGHYRDVDTKFKGSKLYFDDFKRGTKREDVD